MVEIVWFLLSSLLIFFIFLRVPEREMSGIQELSASNSVARSEATLFSDPIEIMTWVLLILFFVLTSFLVFLVN